MSINESVDRAYRTYDRARPGRDRGTVVTTTPGQSQPPLIAHVIYALSVGGLENGLVNLINRMPAAHYRHTIICLTGYDDFAKRISRDDVNLISLNKKPGKDPGLYRRIWWIFRNLRPDIVHTRNLAALEMQIPAFLAGVKARVHGEHGRGADDPDGLNRKHRFIRKVVRPFIGHYIPLSTELENYLLDTIRVQPDRLTRVCNGVDVVRFHPGKDRREGYPPDLRSSDKIIIGAVGRTEAVKDPLNLVQAFSLLLSRKPEWRRRLRLVWIGNGPQFQEVKNALVAGEVTELSWLPGARRDVPVLMRGMDIYVLPSLAEGISNTIMGPATMTTGSILTSCSLPGGWAGVVCCPSHPSSS